MVWFLAQHLFDFSPSVVYLMLFLLFFITQERKVIQTHILKVKIKTPEEEWILRIYLFFLIKQSYRPNSMREASSMSKDSNNLRKPHFGCYFCRSLVNFKNLIILFWNIWIIYSSWKSWRSIVFDSEHIKNDS